MTDTYGELDVLFITTSSTLKPSKPKRHRVKTFKTLTQLREISRIRAQKFRARRNSEFLASVKYSESLLKQNEKLKLQICHLKNQLKELIVLCQKKINIKK